MAKNGKAKNTISTQILQHRSLSARTTEQLHLHTEGQKKRDGVCVKIMRTPYNLVALEELLRNNQYLRLKDIKRLEDRLVSIEERSLPQGIDLRKI